MQREPILIKNATFYSGSTKNQGDILIEKGKIQKIGNIKNVVAKEIDASNLIILPGAFDIHVHFRTPGMEWKEDFLSGSKAAVSGGITSFFDMPNNDPPATDRSSIEYKKKLASENSIANYAFYAGATENNAEELSKIPNICGIKIYMGSSTGNLLVDQESFLENIFAKNKRTITVHAECESILVENKKKYPEANVFNHLKIRSSEAAIQATKLAYKLAEKYNNKLHIAHVSTKEEVEFLGLKKKVNPNISLEVCPQHFLLSSPSVYEELDTFAQMNPPLREKQHSHGLWEGLTSGIIDCVCSDHAPHTVEEKKLPYGKAPSGLPGTETMLPLLLDLVNKGKCTLNQVVTWLCENPVRIFQIKNKGFIKEGFDADIVLIDMKKKKTIKNEDVYSKSGWTPFHGRETQGWPITTIVNGNIVFQEGSFDTSVKGQEIIFD